MTELTEEEILRILNKEYQNTLQISKKLGKHWYVAFGALDKLASEGKIDKLIVGRNKLWRLKNES